MARTWPRKPLGGNGYGPIGHLPGSRRGPADRLVPEGYARICTVAARDPADEVIVLEKWDGTNVAVARLGREIVALNRAGYLAATSPFEAHRRFAAWVEAAAARFRAALGDGERLCGEWLAQAHGTIYELRHEPFVAFDLLHAGPSGRGRPARHAGYDALVAAADRGGFLTPHLIHRGPPCPVAAVLAYLDRLQEQPGHPAVEPIEGGIWRVERQGVPDIVAKFVRPDRPPGRYLPERTGAGPIWLWDAARSAW